VVCSQSDGKDEVSDREIAMQMYQLTEGLPYYGSIDCLHCPLDASIKQKLAAYFTYPIDLMTKETDDTYRHFMALADLELEEVQLALTFFDEYLPERTRAGHAQYYSHIKQRGMLLEQKVIKQTQWDGKIAELEAKGKEIPTSVAFSLKMIEKYKAKPKFQEELEALQQITYIENVEEEIIYFYFNGEQMHFPATLKTREGLAAHFSSSLLREMQALRMTHALRISRIDGHLKKMEGRIRTADAYAKESYEEEANEVIMLSLQRYRDSHAIYTRMKHLEEVYFNKRLTAFQARMGYIPKIVLVARCILEIRSKEERLKGNNPN
jgi:hypothetical protein